MVQVFDGLRSLQSIYTPVVYEMEGNGRAIHGLKISSIFNVYIIKVIRINNTVYWYTMYMHNYAIIIMIITGNYHYAAADMHLCLQAILDRLEWLPND